MGAPQPDGILYLPDRLYDRWTKIPYDHYNEWLSETYGALKKRDKKWRSRFVRRAGTRRVSRRGSISPSGLPGVFRFDGMIG